MSSRRAGDAQIKRVSNSFSIEALIAKDRKSTDKEEDQEHVVESRKHVEDSRRVQKDVTRHSSSVEHDVERLTRIHQIENSSMPGRKAPVRDDDDDDDDDDKDDKDDDQRRRSSEERRDCVSTVSDKLQQQHHHHHHQYHHQQQQQQQQRGHHYQHHLQQFQQLLTRPMMDSVHPLMRQNVLSSSQLGLGAATETLLRRPTAASALPAANSLFCCPPLPQGLSTASCTSTHQRPGTSRDDELVPFYSWLLSRHGAFFNHRIHPAGRPIHCTDRVSILLLHRL